MSDMDDLTPTTSSNTAAADPRSKALIWAGGGDPHRQANDARDALAAANTGSHPRVMVHGNALVRMNEDGGLENLSVNSLIDELSRIAQFQQGKDEPVDVSPPERVAKILLDRDPKDMAGMPRVRRVAETPVYVPGPDNRPRLVSTPGLDRESGVYYVPAPGLEDMLIPTGGIGVGEVEEALDTIENELFVDFGFEDEADRANAIGLLLLPFVREIIDGPTPLFLARAPTPVLARPCWSRPRCSPAVGRSPTNRTRAATSGRSGSRPPCSPVGRSCSWTTSPASSTRTPWRTSSPPRRGATASSARTRASACRCAWSSPRPAPT
jgi:hypothetical protein